MLTAIKAALAGGSLLAVLLAVYIVSVLFWTWIIMVLIGAAGIHWSFDHVLLPWGAIAPFLLG